MVRRLIRICRIEWWCPLFHFRLETTFLGKFGSKNRNCQFTLKFGTKTNSNIQNSVVMFTFSVLDWNQYFLPKLVRNEYSIQEPLCRTNISQYCISYRGPYLWNKIEISKNLTFGDSDSLQALKCELKRFLLSVELNYLGILE